MQNIRFMQTEGIDKGDLKVEVVGSRDNQPIRDAQISISYSGEPDSVIEEVNTDENGMSESLSLNTPPLEYSMQPGENQPFSQYTIQVSCPSKGCGCQKRKRRGTR